MTVPRRRAVASLLVAMSSVASAQTNDRVFRSWRWPQETGSARSAGWGGLTVAVPDDAGVIDANPAALGSLSKNDAFAGIAAFGDGSAPVGDDAGSRRALGLSGVALRLGSRWTLGVTAAQTRAVRLSLAGVRLADGSTDTGALDVSVLDLGAGIAWRLRPRVHVGARIVSSRLSLTAAAHHVLASGLEDLLLESDGSSTRVGGGVGVMYDVTSKVTFGFASQAGMGYPLARSAQSPLLGVVLDPGSRYGLRRPSAFAAGLHVRLSPRFAAAAQLDYVRWSEIPDGLVIANGARSRDEYRLDDALEPRLGGEFSIALRRTSIQVRAGLHAQAPGTLRFAGEDAAEGSAFPGSDWNVAGSVGASIVTAAGLRLDLAGRFGGERPAFLATAGVRF